MNHSKYARYTLASKNAIAAVSLLAVTISLHAENAENPLTWNGLTLYGTVDVGVSSQSHGQPTNDFYSAGAYYFPNKASNDAESQLSGNGLSQSTIGLRGQWALSDEWSTFFKLESAVNPTSLRLSDSQKALTQNNGKPITQQTAAADNSLTGPFSMAMYAGFRSDTYGSISLGRQNTPLKDNFLKYDALGNASAFSAFGAFGTPAGGGSTENARLNDSLRYQKTFDNWRADAIYAFPSDSQSGKAWQIGVGSKFGALSIDGTYAEKEGSIVASSLGIDSAAATSVRWLSQSHVAAGYEYATPNSVSKDSALAGTVSDNKAWGLFAKYELGAPTLYAGYEHISYSNPSSPRTAGFDSIGGYTFAVVNNGAYVSEKNLDVTWIGVKHQYDSKLALLAGVYFFQQNAYTGNACTAPASTSPGTTVTVDVNSPCSSGTQRTISLAATYKFNSYVDGYIGIMQSELTGGMASGFAFPTVYNAMSGIKINF